MDRRLSDEQLDRALIRILAEQGAEIEASGITPATAAARVDTTSGPAMPRRLIWAGLLALLALTTLVATWATVGQHPPSTLTIVPGSIAFARDGVLYVAAPDGSGRRLVDRADADADAYEGIYDVAFAPDGSAMAFLEVGGSTQTLVMVSANGERLGSFSPETDEGIRFDWAPDGHHLAYLSGGELVPHAIAIVGLDGRSEASLPLPDGFGRNTSGGDVGPLWSPDGRWIAVAGCQNPCDTKYETHILLVAADGSGYRWLTDDRSLQDYSMAWSADSRLAVGRWGGRRTVDVMSSDGSVLRSVTMPTDRGAERLAWSPDGTRVAVEASGLVVIDADGVATVVPMTTDPASGPGLAGWSQDGRELLFTTQMNDGPTTLWAVDATGGTPRLLIDSVDWPGPLDTLGPLP